MFVGLSETIFAMLEIHNPIKLVAALFLIITCFRNISVQSSNNFIGDEYYKNLLHGNRFQWKDIAHYYYPTLQHKLEAILYQDCKKSYVILPVNSSIITPSDRDKIYVIPFPPHERLETFWRNIPKPAQMRVDPYLCEAVNIKKRPIFNNTGCQLPHYMSSGAPRCQTSFLKWICDQSSMPINQSIANGFVLPEADHLTWINPPQPWLLSVRESLVTMCGQIVTKCGTLIRLIIGSIQLCHGFVGLIHTNANCMATGQRSLSQLFQKRCSLDKFTKVSFEISELDLVLQFSM